MLFSAAEIPRPSFRDLKHLFRFYTPVWAQRVPTVDDPILERRSLLSSPGVVPIDKGNSGTHRTLISSQLTVCMLSLPVLKKQRQKDHF